ncbi:putative peptidase S10, serine carboxypeptidase, alpha/beta hydrolase fold protein [Tanacetum coccineum]
MHNVVTTHGSNKTAANIIFLDVPAGVGFSYAKTWEASRSSDSILALHSYDFLKKGCLIVSPVADKLIDFNSRFEYAHRLALISDDIYESTKETCRGNYIYNDPSNTICSDNLQQVDECTSGINLSNILDPLCDAVDPEPTCREADNIFIDVWANDKDVQKALHVREVQDTKDKNLRHLDSRNAVRAATRWVFVERRVGGSWVIGRELADRGVLERGVCWRGTWEASMGWIQLIHGWLHSRVKIL